MFLATKYRYPISYGDWISEKAFRENVDPDDLEAIRKYSDEHYDDYVYRETSSFRNIALEFLNADSEHRLELFMRKYGDIYFQSSTYYLGMSKFDSDFKYGYVPPKVSQDLYKRIFLLYEAIKKRDSLTCILLFAPLIDNEYFDFRLDSDPFFAYQGEIEEKNLKILYEGCSLYDNPSSIEIIEIIQTDQESGRIHIYDQKSLTIATYILCEVIDHFVLDITTWLVWDPNKKRFVTQLISQSLLSCLFMELHQIITENKYVRKCENKKCGNYFEIQGNDMRKIYCCNSCALAEAKRKQREREKARKEK